LTLVGHVYALIPGSLVIDVDRPTSTLFLHVIDIPDESAAQAFRDDSLDIEARMIRGFGSKRDYALLKLEEQADDGDVARHAEVPEVCEAQEVFLCILSGLPAGYVWCCGHWAFWVRSIELFRVRHYLSGRSALMYWCLSYHVDSRYGWLCKVLRILL